MTTTERPPKRLLRCEHPSGQVCEQCLAAAAEILARYQHPAPAAEGRGRETVALADVRQPVARARPLQLEGITDDDERYGDSPLGVLGAWACVALAALLMIALLARNLWLWLT